MKLTGLKPDTFYRVYIAASTVMGKGEDIFLGSSYPSNIKILRILYNYNYIVFHLYLDSIYSLYRHRITFGIPLSALHPTPELTLTYSQISRPPKPVFRSRLLSSLRPRMKVGCTSFGNRPGMGIPAQSSTSSTDREVGRMNS